MTTSPSHHLSGASFFATSTNFSNHEAIDPKLDLTAVETMTDLELSRLVRSGVVPSWYPAAAETYAAGGTLDPRIAEAFMRWRLAAWIDPRTGRPLPPPSRD